MLVFCVRSGFYFHGLRLLGLYTSIYDDGAMPAAIVLVNTEIGAESQVMEALSQIEGVKEIHVVYGMYDIVVKAEADSHESLRELVINKIRRIPQVRGTTTMIIIESKII